MDSTKLGRASARNANDVWLRVRVWYRLQVVGEISSEANLRLQNYQTEAWPYCPIPTCGFGSFIFVFAYQ